MKQFADLPDSEILALTIYGEARGEPYLGKVAVGSVILNRVDHRKWDGETVSEVCLKPFQFSCFLKNDPNSMMLLDIAQNVAHEVATNKVFRLCLEIADGLLDGSIERFNEALQYHDARMKPYPKWTEKMKRLNRIGHHIFYV